MKLNRLFWTGSLFCNFKIIIEKHFNKMCIKLIDIIYNNYKCAIIIHANSYKFIIHTRTTHVCII